jgi:hypothetical protein
LFSGVPGMVLVSLLRYAKKVNISAARGAIVLGRAWCGSLYAEICQKKFMYRPLEAQLFSGVPGVVAFMLRYAKKVHISAA